MSTPTAPTYFTVVADYKSVVVDILSDPDFDPQLGPISARVTFTPIIDEGSVLAATTALPRPTGFIAAPIVGRIDTDGKLKLRVDPDGVRLDLASRSAFPPSGVIGRIYHAIDNSTYWQWTGTKYIETYSYTPIRLLANTALLELSGPLFYRVEFSEVVLNGKPGVINPFTFQAPTSDIELNLIGVGNAPGQPASGITKIAPGGVRLNSSGQIVFTFGGVDIPDPLTLTTTSVAGPAGPTGPAGPKGDKGDQGPKGDPATSAATAGDVASIVSSAPQATTPADPDLFTFAKSPTVLQRLSWASLKAAILAWFGPVTATLSNKTLGAGTTYQNPAGGTAFALGGTNAPGHLLFTTAPEGGAAGVRTEGATNLDIVLIPGGGTPGNPSAPGGRLIVNAGKTGHDSILLSNGVDAAVDWNFVTKGAGQVKANGAPIVTTTGAQSLSNKTLVSPTLSGGPVVNGAKLGGRVAVPATATTASLPGNWAADANFMYAYTGDGATHSWVRSAAATW